MFIAEVKNLLLTAGHDLGAIHLPVTLGAATGAERYTMLNGREQTLKAGDMLMADGEGIISSVLYGPDQRTRITPGTRDVLFAVYAPAGIGEPAVRQHLTDIQESVLLIAPDARTELLAVYPAR
jgi:DNA/RNA-binding domain of Phe-tRNA-synthetase-like protein